MAAATKAGTALAKDDGLQTSFRGLFELTSENTPSLPKFYNPPNFFSSVAADPMVSRVPITFDRL